jgi:hypothetical protein
VYILVESQVEQDDGAHVMNLRVKQAQPLENFRLRLTFANGEQRVFNVSPYLAYPAFKRLANPAFFSLGHAEHGTVVWPENIDFCPDTLYVESVKEEQEGVFR